MAKVLVIGVDSMIGANFALNFGRMHECVGLYGRRAVEPAGCSSQAADLTCPVSVSNAVQAIRPDWIVYCGDVARNAWDGFCDFVDETPVVQAISDIASEERAAFTVITSDAVCGGPHLFCEESSAVTPISELGRRARAIEQILQKSDALVVRTHAYGWSPDAHETNLAQQIAQCLQAGERVVSDGVRYATPLLASDLAELLMRAHEVGLKGLYHITGAERTNVDRFARQLGVAMEISAFPAYAQGPEQDAVLHQSACETSLNTRRARRDLGCPLPLLREGLERFVTQAHNGYLEQLRLVTSSARLHPVAA